MIAAQNNLKLKVIIVGAGLGGLAVGINLRQRGHIVTILEGASELGEVGAGIQIPPNSVKLLAKMGLYDKVFCIEYYAHSIVHLAIRDRIQALARWEFDWNYAAASIDARYIWISLLAYSSRRLSTHSV